MSLSSPNTVLYYILYYTDFAIHRIKNPSLFITHLLVINLSLGVIEQHVRNTKACFTLSCDNHHYPHSQHGNFSSFAGHIDTHLDHEIQENVTQFFPGNSASCCPENTVFLRVCWK